MTEVKGVGFPAFTDADIQRMDDELRATTFCDTALLAVTPPTPERVKILREGAKLTGGDRDVEYGDPKINLACAGELKTVFRKYLARDISHAEQEAIDMVLTKIARVATGPKPKRDTYVDGTTYFAIAGETAFSSLDKSVG